MKKLVTIALLCAMLLSCFAGCAMQKGEIEVAGEANVAEVAEETVIGIKDDLRANVEAAKKGTLTVDVDTWDGTESEAWRTRAVTGEDGKTTTTIESAEELVNFRTQMKTETTFFAGWEITLTKNIDFGGNDTLEGISAQFAGTFDGGNHVIYNYTMSLAKNCGFFGNIQGTGEQPASVKNVAFVDATCTATGGNVGSVAGNVKGAANIENVYSNATMDGAAVQKVGGFFGSVTGAPAEGADPNGYKKYITNCEFGGTITSKNTGSAYVSGIAGGVNGGYAYFSYCAVAADAEIVCAGSYVGGITAYANTVNALEISHCVNNANLKGVNGIGGLVAQCYRKKGVDETYKIVSSTNNGTITGTGNYIGGIVGEYNLIKELIIADCTNNGAVSGVNNVGGVLGGVIDGVTSPISITGCENKATIIGASEVSPYVGKVTEGATSTIENCTNLVMAGYQVTAVGEDNKYDIRFVAAFDDDNAKAAGFVVSVYYKDANGKQVKFENKTVYASTVYTAVKGVDATLGEVTYAAETYGADYLYTLVLENIPDDYTVDAGTLEIIVTPFITDANAENVIKGLEVHRGEIVIEEPAA